MAPYRHVKEPMIFGSTTKNFMHWKKAMMNYLNILDLWNVVEKGYKPTFSTVVTENSDDIKIETPDSKATKKENDIAVNAIYNLVHESVASLFGSITSAKDMWDALVNRYEGNTQIKRTKITGLEVKFETFKVEVLVCNNLEVNNTIIYHIKLCS